MTGHDRTGQDRTGQGMYCGNVCVCVSGEIEEVIDDEGSEDHEGTESTAESEGVVLGSPSSRPGSRNMTGVREHYWGYTSYWGICIHLFLWYTYIAVYFL